MSIDVPIYENGKLAGRAVAVPDPPPARWAAGPDRFELKTLEVCRRFGCGCFWQEVRAYVPEDSSPSTSAGVRIKAHDSRSS